MIYVGRQPAGPAWVRGVVPRRAVARVAIRGGALGRGGPAPEDWAW
jgi:hypothetical protein